MNAARLKTLYHYMLALPNHVVNMDSWRRTEDEHNGKVTNKDLKAGIEDTSCGTAACALGWACAIPEFKADGLAYKRDRPGSFWRPQFGYESGFGAAAEFFDIIYDDAVQLFDTIDDDEIGDHKYVFLTRLREYLLEEDEITPIENLKMQIEELQNRLLDGVY